MSKSAAGRSDIFFTGQAELVTQSDELVTSTDLVAHGPCRVDQSPVGGARYPVVCPPLIPVC